MNPAPSFLVVLIGEEADANGGTENEGISRNSLSYHVQSARPPEAASATRSLLLTNSSPASSLCPPPPESSSGSVHCSCLAPAARTATDAWPWLSRGSVDGAFDEVMLHLSTNSRNLSRLYLSGCRHRPARLGWPSCSNPGVECTMAIDWPSRLTQGV